MTKTIQSEIEFLEKLAVLKEGKENFYRANGYTKMQVSRLRAKHSFDGDKFRAAAEVCAKANLVLPDEWHIKPCTSVSGVRIQLQNQLQNK